MIPRIIAPMSDARLPPPLPGSKSAPKRKAPRKTIACIAAILLLGMSSWFDFPAVADPFPWELEKALEDTKARCYVYKVFDRIIFEFDKTYLWTIDGDAEEIAAVIKALEEEYPREVPTAPAAFWKMPPYYWPKNLKPGMKCYRTYGFSDSGYANGRPSQSCIVTDIPNHRAYVWHVDLF